MNYNVVNGDAPWFQTLPEFTLSLTCLAEASRPDLDPPCLFTPLHVSFRSLFTLHDFVYLTTPFRPPRVPLVSFASPCVTPAFSLRPASALRLASLSRHSCVILRHPCVPLRLPAFPSCVTLGLVVPRAFLRLPGPITVCSLSPRLSPCVPITRFPFP